MLRIEPVGILRFKMSSTNFLSEFVMYELSVIHKKNTEFDREPLLLACVVINKALLFIGLNLNILLLFWNQNICRYTQYIT